MSSDATLRRHKRPVYDENGRLHPSITEAAIECGLTISGAWSRARLQLRGWRFADEAPRQPAAPFATSEG
jgi:hypothetical protein